MPDPSENRLVALDKLLAQEEKMWEVQGVNRGMIAIDGYLMNIKMRMVLRILAEKFDMTTEDLDAILKEEALEQLKQDRKMLVKAMKAQELLVPQPGSILGPNGTPI